jgi:ribosomal protein L18E
MVTTIQLNEKVKKALSRLRETGKETYEEIIVKMMRDLEKQRRRRRELLIEGAKEMAEDNLRITREFEVADSEIDWEWNEN